MRTMPPMHHPALSAHPALPLTCLTLRLSSRGLLSAVYAASSTVLMLEVVAVDSTAERYLGMARGHPAGGRQFGGGHIQAGGRQFDRWTLVRLTKVGRTLPPPHPTPTSLAGRVTPLPPERVPHTCMHGGGGGRDIAISRQNRQSACSGNKQTASSISGGQQQQ